MTNNALSYVARAMCRTIRNKARSFEEACTGAIWLFIFAFMAGLDMAFLWMGVRFENAEVMHAFATLAVVICTSLLGLFLAVEVSKKP